MTSLFHHVALTVKSLERSVRHYCDVFGFEVVRTHSANGRTAIAHLRQPGTTFVLELIQRSSIDPQQQTCVHLGFKCSDLSLVESLFHASTDSLSAQRTTVGSENILWITDDDGYVVELNDSLV